MEGAAPKGVLGPGVTRVTRPWNMGLPYVTSTLRVQNTCDGLNKAPEGVHIRTPRTRGLCGWIEVGTLDVVLDYLEAEGSEEGETAVR